MQERLRFQRRADKASIRQALELKKLASETGLKLDAAIDHCFSCVEQGNVFKESLEKANNREFSIYLD
ncbi:MAG TPA: hypothetical protein VFD45_03255 [Patescibacteria group bacterium]|nr:hypothetical protein [Patescibacteria group bacterium]